MNGKQKALISLCRQCVSRALQDDSLSLCIVYQDAEGSETERIVSPIRFDAGLRPKRFLALCTGREEPRWFILASIKSIELVASADVPMPSPIKGGKQ